MSYPTIKRALDVAVAAVLLVLATPGLLLIVALIGATSGRPIFFRQVRAGRGGKPFGVFKFRTLRDGAHDPQRPEAFTTPVGRLLRRYALDELPQLWNVLRGEMSLVGPRPILPAEAAGYTARQRKRLDVRPGLTGWAQINGRNALPWHERVEYDLWYVDHLGPWLDLRILLKTPWALLSGKGVYGPGNRDPDEEALARHRRQAAS